MDFEGTLSNAENIGSFTTEDFARESAAITCAPHDLLDRHPVFGESKNDSVGLLPPEIAVILDRLGGGEQIGIDFGRADRYADVTHRFAHRIKESVAGVLHQVPAIRDLNRERERFLSRQRVTAPPIARDDGDLWLTGEPRFSCRWFAIREQCDRSATFEIANDCPVALVASPCPVVDPNYRRRLEARTATPAHET